MQDALESTTVVGRNSEQQDGLVRGAGADLSRDARNDLAGAASDLQSVWRAAVPIGVNGLVALADLDQIRSINDLLQLAD
jgi:hypothetical protein